MSEAGNEEVALNEERRIQVTQRGSDEELYSLWLTVPELKAVGLFYKLMSKEVYNLLSGWKYSSYCYW